MPFIDFSQLGLLLLENTYNVVTGNGYFDFLAKRLSEFLLRIRTRVRIPQKSSWKPSQLFPLFVLYLLWRNWLAHMAYTHRVPRSSRGGRTNISVGC